MRQSVAAVTEVDARLSSPTQIRKRIFKDLVVIAFDAVNPIRLLFQIA